MGRSDSTNRFEQLVQEALEHTFSGWDFSWLHGRWFEAEPNWNYRQIVQEKVEQASSLLDMGTGGGEFLASLTGLPPVTYATEGYAPNIPVARERLAPLGVTVVPVEDDETLPLSPDFFALIINRHESFHLPEVWRVLAPGGAFLTQQVGPRNDIQLNQFLNGPLEPAAASWTLAQECAAMAEAGFEVLHCEEQLLESTYYDIGAVVYYLKVIAWQIPDFSIEAYRERLLAMHQLIERQGAFYATAHRFLIKAHKP